MQAPSSSPSSSSSASGKPRSLRFLVAFIALLGVAGYLVTQYVMGGSGPARCTVRAESGDGDGGKTVEYEVRPVQAANAATIEAVASSRRLPERAVTIALATAMQESGLRNISHGDRDSLGLFQQRPSQGWGTEKQIMDPVYSTGKFFDHLVKVPGYSRLPLTVAAQKVQRSGYPQAYAKHETNAALLTQALTGRANASLNCTTGPEGIAEAGDAAEVRERLVREFGKDVLGGSDPGGGGRSKGARDLVLPVSSEKRGRELAHWAVAHSSELHITQIAYGDRAWSAELSEEGWREPEEPETDESAVLLRVADSS